MDLTAKGVALALPMLWRLRWVRELPATQGWLEAHARIASKLLRRAGGLHARILGSLWIPGLNRLLLWLGERQTAGAHAHVLCRKIWFRDTTLEALTRGGRQVLGLGTGLDPTAICLAPEHPDACFVELDRTSVLRVKEGYLHSHPVPNLHLWSRDLAAVADLATDLAADLAGIPGFDLHRPTLVTAEGLFMYLPQKTVEQILQSLCSTLAGGMTLAFSALDDDPARAPALDRIQKQLRRHKISWHWRLDRDQFAPWLQGLGFTGVQVFCGEELQQRYLPEPRPVFGEVMVRARAPARTPTHGI